MSDAATQRSGQFLATRDDPGMGVVGDDVRCGQHQVCGDGEPGTAPGPGPEHLDNPRVHVVDRARLSRRAS